ncbi:helix-turn-helix domain-containing protein [Promicromonospora iranensis]|uniref:Transcriptional regulator with XRE-family HTH domain n=1 Tax=Promicromonospora iranensis TaxID=1105144 RepID=A0ABU2CW68_9MICO|nr:helix-turn-helix transcriptional regulator [Promicromonospora iranensis]MDR7385571.1 transcriptional regulator with XRE-family HTH domain [Promicromonospora iranensis]
MTDEPNLLGEYLRARRERVGPERVGLPRSGVRRVPGLRREEVALLAGISADYYLRLEQGRDRNPSVQVLESLARVLQLDDAGTAYLLGLAGDRPRRRRRPARRETVPAGTLKLLGAIGLPAFVEGRYLDVLAANPLATAVSPRLVAGRNRLRDVFLDPAEQALYAGYDPAAVAAEMVAGFRQLVGAETDDPRLVELVGELSLASPTFREAWARHDVMAREGTAVTLDHPEVGALTLNREKLAVGGAPGLTLVVYHADAGTAAADKLQMLASYSAPARPEDLVT